MDQTADGDVQPGLHTERDVRAVTRVQTVGHQDTVGVGSRAPEPPPEAASHQVVVGDIPLEPPGFLLRPDLLARLDQAHDRVAVIHAATGLRGAGTTQLAGAYARAKLAAGWRLVAWVNAADVGSLQAGLAAVADALGLTDGDSGPGIVHAGQAVRHLLETDGDRCLLVFDDAADPEALRPFIPVGGRARVLVVSTRLTAANVATGIPLSVFTADEALRFLTRWTGLDDEAGAAAVADALGNLPLALALAAPVIEGQQYGYARYLDRLQMIPVEVFLTADDGRSYPHGIARAVLLSLAVIRAADQTGVSTRVLDIMAVLSAAGVRRDLLHAAGQAGVLTSGGRRVEAAMVDRVLEWLSDRALVTFSLDGQTVIMHRQVAEVVRGRLARRQRLGAACWAAASALEAHAISIASSPDHVAARNIPQHVTALLESTPRLAGEADEELAVILLGLRFIALYHLVELGDSGPLAIAAGVQLAADLKRLLGADHPDTLNARNSLAAAYLAGGRAAEAIPLFEQTLALQQRLLGPHHPDTLTIQNNLAAAYQHAGRAAEAIRLCEQTLSAREQLLGADHPSTLSSRGNLAAAYRDGGRPAEAIPLFEQTLADRERVLGPDHPDTQMARKNLANAYRDAGRIAEATPLFERVLGDRKRALHIDHRHVQTSQAGLATANRDGSRAVEALRPAGRARGSQPHVDAYGQLPVGFRRPPADPVKRALPSGFRRPPAGPARRPLPGRAAASAGKLTGHASAGRRRDPPRDDVRYDREVVAAIAAGDPAGIAKAFDRYAAALYGYCHWALRGTAGATGALQDTFVIAAAKLSDLSEPPKLRPWLYAVARGECQRRLRVMRTAYAEDADAADQRADTDPRADTAAQLTRAAAPPIDATMPMRPISQPILEPIDSTMSFRVVGEPIDATMPMRAIGQPIHEPIHEPMDATMPMRAIGQPIRELIDATTSFRVVSQPIDSTMSFRVVSEPIDATMPMRAIGQPTPELIDATTAIRVVSQLTDPINGSGHVTGDRGQAELQALIRSVLVDLKPAEREVIELNFRHDLFDHDLAVALGVSSNRAAVLASRARVRLEKWFGAVHATLTGRQVCPVLGELLVDWDGQLTEETRDLASWHVDQCQTCANHGNGALRPAVLSRLLPLPPLPPELRQQVLSRCYAVSQDAVAYRRRVVRRSESKWSGISAIFAQAIGRLRWDNIRAHPGPALATTAVAVWVAAAVSVPLLTFTGVHVAHASDNRPSVGTSVSSPAVPAVPVPITASSSSSVRPTPTVIARRSATQAPPPYVPSASPGVTVDPSPSSSPSPTPSQSLQASPSPSPSLSSSPSGSPSPSPTGSTSPSPTKKL